MVHSKGPCQAPTLATGVTGSLDSVSWENLVHGDLRDTNIIVKKDERVLLVDFDWGGKDGRLSIRGGTSTRNYKMEDS